MIGNQLLYGKIPGHFPRIAHPFRVGLCILPGDGHTACDSGFGAAAVPGPEVQGLIHGDGYLAPGKEAVQLPLFLSPEPHIDHTVGGTLPGLAPPGIVPHNHRLRLRQRRIAQEILDVKGFELPGLLVVGRKGMPPPVIPLLAQRAFEHTVISGYIAFVHGTSPFFLDTM